MAKKLEASNLKTGDRLSRISYLEVLSTGRMCNVKNEEGLEWSIDSNILENECYSADQFVETREVNRTELITTLSEVGNAVFTVNFDKLPTADDFLSLTRDDGNKIRAFDDMKKDFKKLKGENRTLVGYLIKTETGFGRSMVIDLDIKESNKIRQVDHRTLNWLIVRNIKYVIK